MGRTPTTITTAPEPPALAVVTHDSRADLERFLGGQLATAESLGTPIVVVDNDSRDGTPEFVSALAGAHPRLRLVRMSRNAGYAAAVNAAFAELGARDVLLVNPDVAVSGAEPVAELAGILHRHPRVAVVAPRLVDARGRPQASARRFPSLGALAGSLPRVGELAPLRRARERYEEPSSAAHDLVVDWVIGAAMLIRRTAFEAVGGWDERFFLYCEDVDFCRRCGRAGWEIAYVPRVRLLHRYERRSAAGRRDRVSALARRRHYASHARLFARAPQLALGRGRGRDRPLGLAGAPGPGDPVALGGR